MPLGAIMTACLRSAWTRYAKAFVVALAMGGALAGPSVAHADGVVAAPASNRITVNMGATPWRYLGQYPKSGGDASQPSYNDANQADGWVDVGVPYTPNDKDSFINGISGGGDGFLSGSTNWYRKHFTLDQSLANRKVYVEFEGAHMGVRVYINGQFLPGNSLVAVNQGATHVNGFVPFIVDVTNFVHFDGTDNVLSVNVARGDTFFQAPNFSGAYRFGQSDAGLFRPVTMYVTDKVHIPRNTFSVLNTWGTYVSTIDATSVSADIHVQTNVLNEYSDGTARDVVLNTQIVDASGNVVASQQAEQTIAANPQIGRA